MKLNVKPTVITAAILFALTGGAAHAGKPNSNKIELMYFQHANKAHISESTTEKNCYALTLLNPSPQVIYFSNQPVHQSGKISSEKFNTSLKHAKAEDGIKPNALLHASQNASGSDDSSISFPVTILKSDYDQAKKNMTYTICPMEKAKIAFKKKTTLHHIDLFIDGVDPWPP